MNRIISVVFVLLLAIGGGYLYFLQQIKAKPLPIYVIQAENALATNDSVILAYLNIGYASKLESKLYGKSDPSPLLKNNDKAPEIIKILQNNGVDIRKQLKYILAAFYNQKASATVLFGDFNTKQIIKSLQQTYIITKEENNGLITFIRKSKKNCQLSDPMTIEITKNRITIASPSIIAKILDRLEKQSPAGIDLSAWIDFRKNRIASLGFIAPKNSSNALPNGLIRHIVQSTVKKNIPDVNSVFIGASINKSHPIGITLETALNTENSDWIKKATENIENKRKKFIAENYLNSPSLAELNKYFLVSSKEKQLNLSLTFNRKTLDEIENTIKEAVRSFFSTSGFSSPINNKTLEDKIISEEKLPQFFDNYTHDNLINYKIGSNHFLKEDAINGPFAIMLEKIQLIDKNGEKTAALTLQVKTSPINNIPINNLHSDEADGAAAIFRITDIYDAQNNSLLAKEECGNNRNDEAVGLDMTTSYIFKDGKSLPYNFLEGKKTVRLASGVNADRIAGIKGSITLALPTDIKVKKFQSPLIGKNIQTENMRIYFKKDQKRELNYEISGKKNHILSVQALNIDGKPLESMSGSASTSIFIDGLRSISKDIRGTIAGAEVTYATDSINKTYDFNIVEFLNHYDKKTWSKKAIAVKTDKKENFAKYIPLYDFSDFCRENTTSLSLPPFQLCLHSLNYHGKSWGADIRFSMAAPDSPALNQNLFGTEIRIENIKFKDGENIKSVAFPMQGYMLLNKIKRNKDKYAFLKTQQQSIRSSDPKGILDKKKIIGATGKIIIRLPKHLKSRGMYARLLNSNMTTDDKSLVLVVSEVAYNSITITAAGDIGKLVQIIPITKDKKPLPLNSIDIKKKDGTYLIKLEPIGGMPEFLNVVYAVKQDKFSIPFDIVKP